MIHDHPQRSVRPLRHDGSGGKIISPRETQATASRHHRGRSGDLEAHQPRNLQALIVLKPGDIFGEMAVIEKKPRSATAIASKPCKLLAMDESLFFKMIEGNPDFAVKMVRMLSERIRRSNTLIQNLASSNRESLVLSGFKDYARMDGIDSVRGRRVVKAKFVMWATHHIGLSDQEIQLSLSQLVARGLIITGSVPGELILPPPR
jgi:CRP-like cAMP-binding protein